MSFLFLAVLTSPVLTADEKVETYILMSRINMPAFISMAIYYYCSKNLVKAFHAENPLWIRLNYGVIVGFSYLLSGFYASNLMLLLTFPLPYMTIRCIQSWFGIKVEDPFDLICSTLLSA